MSAKDLFHDAVKNALIKDGWTITHDPFKVKAGAFNLYIDLGAEKMLAAEKAGEKIAVEIKSFTGASFIYEFHAAIGQFINYRYALEEEHPDRMLYLALPDDIYDEYFFSRFMKHIVSDSKLKLIVYEPVREVITAWTK